MSVRDRRGRIRVAAALGGSATLLGAAIFFFVLALQSAAPIRAGAPDSGRSSAGPVSPLATCSGSTDGLLYPLDGTWTLALPFCDDCSSAATPLGFVFDLYGDQYSEAFVNNNGNVSFGAELGPFFRTGFPDATFSTVAAFYADGDTRDNPEPGIAADVYRKSFDGNGDGTPDTFVVTWRNVGYYQRRFDRRNTFQLAISDGTNPTLGLGNNVCFSYDVMCWATGDNDQGTGGFGPVPAVVGVNRGNGVDSLTIGRFNHDGTDYSGPGPAADPGGIHYLDHQTFCFSTATANGNVCPIAADFPQDSTFVLRPLEAFSHVLRFLSPEPGQTTSVTFEDTGGAQAAGLAVTNTPGNMATLSLSFTPTCAALGSYPLLFHASDDFSPSCTTDRGLTLVVSCDDGNPCTIDACDRATGCVHTSGGSCDDGNPCTDDTCDAQGCVHTPNTSSCDDGNPCTTGDQCSDGSCAGQARNCDDANPCTDDSCDGQGGCVHTPNSAPCDDGDPQTSGDRCSDGVCRGQGTGSCDDGNPCTDDRRRDSGGCSHTYNTASCDDGNVCTTRDACYRGRCVGRPRSCGDGDACTRDRCDPHSGCVHDPATDADGDGVCDRLDACDRSILTPTVVIGSCDSGVPNRRLPFGCTISDRLAACGHDGGERGEHGSRSRSRSPGECVERTLALLRYLHVIDRSQQAAIEACYGHR